MAIEKASVGTIDWEWTFAAVDALRGNPVKKNWSVGAKILAAWVLVCGLYAVAALLFPQG